PPARIFASPTSLVALSSRVSLSSSKDVLKLIAQLLLHLLFQLLFFLIDAFFHLPFEVSLDIRTNLRIRERARHFDWNLCIDEIFHLSSLCAFARNLQYRREQPIVERFLRDVDGALP